MRLYQNITSLVVGFLFSIGLSIAGMTQPQNVLGFLNVFDWNPSLVFVMAGAILVHALSYLVAKNKSSPLFDQKWHIPSRKDLNLKLVFGSALFGIGWGLAGFCPGPALTTLASSDPKSIIFVISMLVGMILFKLTSKKLKLKN
jgi:uncharacterized membrane protein YedE/YeeE